MIVLSRSVNQTGVLQTLQQKSTTTTPDRCVANTAIKVTIYSIRQVCCERCNKSHSHGTRQVRCDHGNKSHTTTTPGRCAVKQIAKTTKQQIRIVRESKPDCFGQNSKTGSFRGKSIPSIPTLQSRGNTSGQVNSYNTVPRQ